MSLIERALNEFHSEDDDGKIKTVYAYFGLAVFDCQSLELTLENMIYYDEVASDKLATRRDFEIFLADFANQKNTLGRIIKLVLKKYMVSEDDQLDLSNLLKSRNELSHSYFKNSVEKFYSEKGRLEMLHDFVKTSEISRTLISKLDEYTQKYREKFKITKEVLDVELQELIRNELER